MCCIYLRKKSCCFFCISLSITPFPSPMKSIQKSTEHYLMDGFTIYVHQEGSANFAFYPYQICRKGGGGGIFFWLGKSEKSWEVVNGVARQGRFQNVDRKYHLITIYELFLQVDPCNPGTIGGVEYIIISFKNFSSRPIQFTQR